jgi:hypothetical protein
MNLAKLVGLERLSRAVVAARVVTAVRAAPPQRQTAVLVDRMSACDAATRRVIYRLLTPDELALLCPGMWDFINQLSDAECQALATDPQQTRRALTQIRRQQRGDGGEQPPEPDHHLLRR